ncbi:phospholipase D1 isoform X3 [Lingula anatina]|uniref:phospholipase D n=1 Tax=Lingula anatina TaxID=7574 RepID=A0A1S3K581_LINAN|nr:phospholipase D1 isoform X3 [Lingula anatina]|eukprot:XP_013417793.1 phospholipase D1 isoform X3 [Lingula anatina]
MMAYLPNDERKIDHLESLEADSYQRSVSIFTECSDTDFEELEIPDTADINLDEGDDDDGLPIIPFSSLYRKDLETNFRRKYFIPKTKITVTITDYERKIHKILSPYVYIIKLTHGLHSWSVRRRYKHFEELHRHLMVFKAKLNIPLPNKEHQEQRKKKRFLPRFPKSPDAFITEDRLNRRMKLLQNYLQNVLNSSVYRNHPETLAFLNVSRLSFVYNLGRKLREGSVLKRAGGRRAGTGCFGLSSKLKTGRWSKRWLVLKDTFVAYISSSGRLGDVMLIDDEFDVGYGLIDTGIHHGLIVSNLTRRLMLKCKTHNKAKEWYDAVSDVIKTTADDFTTENRYLSYAPVREDAFANWFVDGDSYFYAVSLALESAKEEIFITDWWLSPEILLRRTIGEGPKWQLVDTLRRKAVQGVKIFVLLYKEVELALGINSLYSKQVLVKELGDNVKVLRHPDHVPGGVLLWAHHEKIVVVDQRIAFVGGLDLCYGRWDDDCHRLTDVGSVSLSCSEEPETASPTPPISWMPPHAAPVCPINNNNKEDMCPIDLVLMETVTENEDVFDEVDSSDKFKDIPFIDEAETVKESHKEKKEGVHPSRSPKKPTVMVPVNKPPNPPKAPIGIKRGVSALSDISEKSETGSDEISNADVQVSAVGTDSNGECNKDETRENREAVSDKELKQMGKENVFFPSRSTNTTAFSDIVQRLMIHKNRLQETFPEETKNAITVDAVIEPVQEDGGKGSVDPAIAPDPNDSNQIGKFESLAVPEDDSTVQDEIDKNQNIFMPTEEADIGLTGKYKVSKVELDDGNQLPETRSKELQNMKIVNNNDDGLIETPKKAAGKETVESDPVESQKILSLSPKSNRKKSALKSPSPISTPKTERKETTIKKSEVTFTDDLEKNELTPRASPATQKKKKDVAKSKQNKTKKDGQLLLQIDSDRSSFDSTVEPKTKDKKYKKKEKKTKYKKKDDMESKSLEHLDESDGLLHQKIEGVKGSAQIDTDVSSFDSAVERQTKDKKYKRKDKKRKKKKKDHKESKSLEHLDESDGLLQARYEVCESDSQENSTPEPKRKSKTKWKSNKDSDSDGSDVSDSSDPTATWPRAKLVLKKAVQRMKSRLGSSSSEEDGEDGEAEHDKHYKTWTASKMTTMSKAMDNFKLGLKSKKPQGLKLKIERQNVPTLVVSSPSPVGSNTDLAYEHSDDEHPVGDTKRLSKPLDRFRKASRLASRLASMHSVYRQKSVDMTVEEEDSLIYKQFMDKQKMLYSSRLGLKKSRNFSKISFTHGSAINEDQLKEMGLEGNTKIWIGKDYANFILKDFGGVEEPYADSVDRNTIPRMPWHDIGSVVFGKPARDVARHFIQRWNFTKQTKAKYNHDYPFLVPKSYEHTAVPQGLRKYSFYCRAQVLRSASSWSVGIARTEDSIQQAYIKAIEDAKHYIYIENQFFITVYEHPDVHNGIGEALYKRIIKAHENNETFRVYVVLPLLPGFEGKIGDTTGAALRTVTHWNYQSICRGGKSLLERLLKHMTDPFKYISFYGLRNHDVLNGKLVCELIYVHSKMLIVDDNLVIIGSANINDRSLLGKRDSEMAVLYEDKATLASKMNGKDYEAGLFASSLRRTVFREHLGIKDNETDVTDPVCNEMYKKTWLHRAAINSKVYTQVFNCIPNNDIHNMSQLKELQKQTPLAESNPRKAKLELKQIKGNIVFFPLQFLKEENLEPSIVTKEGMVPKALWT